MENYFVVLQLPDSKELEFSKKRTDRKNFLENAAEAVGSGKAKIVSRRTDTGVSEELRTHAKKINHFSTYVLVTMPLEKKAGKAAIFEKAAKRISSSQSATEIDKTDDFRLVTTAP